MNIPVLVQSNVPLVILNEEELKNLIQNYEKKSNPEELERYEVRGKKIKEFFEFGSDELDLRERSFFLKNILVD